MSAGLLPEVGLASSPDHSRVPVGPGAVATRLSTALAAVAAVTCALILLVPHVLTGTAVMNGSARGTAAVALVLGVPALTTAMVLARRGWARAVPVWLGAVAYLLYNAVLLVFATPFDHLFLLYLLMLSMALWTLVTVLHGLDVRRFAALFAPATPVRSVAIYVYGVVGLNAVAWLAPILRATRTDGPPQFLAGTGLTTSPVYVQDLAFWLPAMAMAATWLWRRSARGYLLVTAGLATWAVESVGVAVDQWFGHAADPASTVASASAGPVFALLAVVGLVPLAAMLRGLPGSNASWPPPPAETPAAGSPVTRTETG